MNALVFAQGIKAFLRNPIRAVAAARARPSPREDVHARVEPSVLALSGDAFGRDGWVAAAVNGQMPAGGIIISGFPGAAEYFVCFM